MRITLDSKFPSAVTRVTFDRDVNVGVPCQNMLLRLLARVRCKGKMIPNSQVVMKIKLKRIQAKPCHIIGTNWKLTPPTEDKQETVP